MEQLGSHWKDFHGIWHFGIFFPKSNDKIPVPLKSDKSIRYFTCSAVYTCNSISRNYS
jgi:hypothetical protein